MRNSKQAQALAGLHNVLPRQQQLLRLAAALRDYDATDAITDDLARMGLCRRRSECVWTTRADTARPVDKGRGPDCS